MEPAGLFIVGIILVLVVGIIFSNQKKKKE